MVNTKGILNILSGLILCMFLRQDKSCRSRQKSLFGLNVVINNVWDSRLCLWCAKSCLFSLVWWHFVLKCHPRKPNWDIYIETPCIEINAFWVKHVIGLHQDSLFANNTSHNSFNILIHKSSLQNELTITLYLLSSIAMTKPTRRNPFIM
jgi:hypothetical protein